MKIFGRSTADAPRDKECEAFLLKELDLMESEIKRLRAEGPARVQFLFTITCALLASLLVLAGLKSLELEWIRRAAIVTSFLFFAFSLVTYTYLIGREISCDRNARATARIRRYFLDRSPELELHISWQTSDAPTQWLREDKSGPRQMTILLSSGAGGLCIGLASFECFKNEWIAYGTGLAVAAIVVYALRSWARRRLREAHAKAVDEQRFKSRT
jgi:hypothetical protein